MCFSDSQLIFNKIIDGGGGGVTHFRTTSQSRKNEKKITVLKHIFH